MMQLAPVPLAIDQTMTYARYLATQLQRLLIPIAVLSACTADPAKTAVDGGVPSDEHTSDAATDPAFCRKASDTFEITDDTNYSLSNTLHVKRFTLKDATDLTFDWSRVNKDFFGKPVDPWNDIDLVVVTLWRLTPEGIEASLKRDELPLSLNQGVVTTYPDGTYVSKNLRGFDLLGNPMPESDLWMRFDTNNPDFAYPQDQFTFMMMASTGTVPGKQARMLALFNIGPEYEDTRLDLTNDSTSLDIDVDLAKAMPVPVPVGKPSLKINWKQMTRNALGNEYIHTQITRAAVAHFATESIAELEQKFLSLQEAADGWWSAEVVSGTSIDLGTLRDANDVPFAGVTTGGTWVVALFCQENCNNPAPWSITFLKACE
jgi:hypothetical protein